METDPTQHQRAPRGDSLRGQTPAALVMMMSIVALTMVNRSTPVAAPTVPAGVCASCGEVVAVRPVTASKFGLAEAPDGGLALDVRMQDGTVRTIRYDAGSAHVGMRVQVDATRLNLRS